MPTNQSVTTAPCECEFLARRANDPHSPFIFDVALNEYHFTFRFGDRDAKMMIYHCPWCGGVASNSHRASLFCDLNNGACREVIAKTKSCVSLEDVIQILGEPDNDEFTVIRHVESSDNAPRADRVRRITFNNLYDDLNVSFIQQIDGTLSQCFVPKHLEERG